MPPIPRSGRYILALIRPYGKREVVQPTPTRWFLSGTQVTAISDGGSLT